MRFLRLLGDLEQDRRGNERVDGDGFVRRHPVLTDMGMFYTGKKNTTTAKIG